MFGLPERKALVGSTDQGFFVARSLFFNNADCVIAGAAFYRCLQRMRGHWCPPALAHGADVAQWESSCFVNSRCKCNPCHQLHFGETVTGETSCL